MNHETVSFDTMKILSSRITDKTKVVMFGKENSKHAVTENNGITKIIGEIKNSQRD